MKKQLSLLPYACSLSAILLGLLFTTTQISAQNRITDNITAKMNDLTRQWLDIAAQRERLESQWENQALFLETQISILENEQTVLKSNLNNRSENTDDVDTRRSSLLEEQSNLETQQEKLAATNEMLNIQINRVRSILPPPLQEQWRNAITSTDNPQTQNSVTAELQQNLELLRLMTEFDRTITVHEGLIETRNSSNQPLLVKQIYLGTSWAWFSTPDGNRTGIGYPAAGGWRWEFLPEPEGRQVLQAISVANGDSSPLLVSLPMIQNRVQTQSGSSQ